jgi:hypothetical protein
MSDPFASHTISLVLAWAFSIPVMLGVLGFAFEVFGKPKEGVPWVWSAWYVLCILVVSPLRYIMLQFVLAGAYGVQSGAAFVSGILCAFYVPIVFGLLWAVGMGLPLLASVGGALILSRKDKERVWPAAVLLPFFCAAGHALFFLLLPYAAWTIRWLPDDDVIRATNGPATLFYRFVVEPDIPRFGPTLQAHGDSAKERLRWHVSHVYVAPEKRSTQNFVLSLRYWQQAVGIHGAGHVFSDSDFQQERVLLKAALHEAEQVDPAVLERQRPGLGRMYATKFIPFLRRCIEFHETRDRGTLARCAALLQEWENWYYGPAGGKPRDGDGEGGRADADIHRR